MTQKKVAQKFRLQQKLRISREIVAHLSAEELTEDRANTVRGGINPCYHGTYRTR